MCVEGTEVGSETTDLICTGLHGVFITFLPCKCRSRGVKPLRRLPLFTLARDKLAGEPRTCSAPCTTLFDTPLTLPSHTPSSIPYTPPSYASITYSTCCSSMLVFLPSLLSSQDLYSTPESPQTTFLNSQGAPFNLSSIFLSSLSSPPKKPHPYPTPTSLMQPFSQRPLRATSNISSTFNTRTSLIQPHLNPQHPKEHHPTPPQPSIPERASSNLSSILNTTTSIIQPHFPGA